MSDIDKIFALPALIPGNDPTLHLIENGDLVASLVYQSATGTPETGIMAGMVRAMDAQVTYAIDVDVEWLIPFHKVAKVIDEYASLIIVPDGTAIRSNGLYQAISAKSSVLASEYMKTWHSSQSVLIMLHITQDGRVRLGAYGGYYLSSDYLHEFWTTNIAPYVKGANHKTVKGELLSIGKDTTPKVETVRTDREHPGLEMSPEGITKDTGADEYPRYLDYWIMVPIISLILILVSRNFS